MGDVVKAKIFLHGGSQAVRLPKAFRFAGSEVRVRKDGDRVILEPVVEPAERDWDAFWARIDAHRVDDDDDNWPEFEDSMPEPSVDLDGDADGPV